MDLKTCLASTLVYLITITIPIGGHEYYNGLCPNFKPMKDFRWGDMEGTWMAAYKMATRSSCVRYTYGIDQDGRKQVVEKKLLPVLGRFSVPSAVKSAGTLQVTGVDPSDMSVEWNTGVMRQLWFSQQSYTILDTDYTTKALICTCHHLNMPFFKINRRSCAFLVRKTPSYTTQLPSEYVSMLNAVDSSLVLDMKRIRQDDCQDLDNLTLDVGEIVENVQDGVDIVQSINTFF